MMKGLIENECAGQNSLIKLSSHFNSPNVSEQQHKLVQGLPTVSQQQSFNSDNLVNEYFGGNVVVGPLSATAPAGVMRAAPRTFHMETLFNELKQIDNNTTTKPPPTNAPFLHQHLQNQVAPNPLKETPNDATLLSSPPPLANTNDWSQSYLSAVFNKQQQQQTPQFLSSIMDDRSLKWSTDYLTQSEATIFDEAWENMLLKNETMGANQTASNPLATGLVLNNDNLIATNQLNEEMRKTANELLDSMQDSRFSETEFLQFVRNLSVNALNSSEKNQLAAVVAASKVANGGENLATTTTGGNVVGNNVLDSISEQEPNFDISDNDLAQEWVREFENLEGKANLNDYWSDLQSEWNTLASENPNHPWLDEFQKVFDTYKTYEFDAENPLRTHPKAFEEGLERLKAHDIVNAVLLFEAAVQSEPDNMLAWQYLGTTQVENEQDPQAIRALRKCLELKADNLTALSTLATSYTNESMQRLAFDSLIKWMKHHPNYAALLKNDEQAARLLAASDLLNQNTSNSPFYMASFSAVHAGDFIDLQEIFLKAVRESSTSSANKIDPDLQCCLGVLFHLSSEYDKAADCFKTALQVKPNDHLLWNKLGATYANNNRNEEAIDAYYQALKLCPGFVRARYNLGIGCMNLGAYKEAVEHFLTALVQQSQACISDRHYTNNPGVTNDTTNNADNAASSSGKTRPNNIQQMSDTIWTTLRLALSYLNRTDLHAACTAKNLEQLKQEFKI